METTFNWRMDNKNVIQIHYEVLCSCKEWNRELCRKIDGTRNDHIEWSNPGLERQISHVLSYLKMRIHNEVFLWYRFQDIHLRAIGGVRGRKPVKSMKVLMMVWGRAEAVYQSYPGRDCKIQVNLHQDEFIITLLKLSMKREEEVVLIWRQSITRKRKNKEARECQWLLQIAAQGLYSEKQVRNRTRKVRKNWNRCNVNVVIRELVGSGDVKIIERFGD